jgi:hypothetical protein
MEKGGRSQYQAGVNSGQQIGRNGTPDGRINGPGENRIGRYHQTAVRPCKRAGKGHRSPTTRHS